MAKDLRLLKEQNNKKVSSQKTEQLVEPIVGKMPTGVTNAAPKALYTHPKDVTFEVLGKDLVPVVDTVATLVQGESGATRIRIEIPSKLDGKDVALMTPGIYFLNAGGEGGEEELGYVKMSDITDDYTYYIDWFPSDKVTIEQGVGQFQLKLTMNEVVRNLPQAKAPKYIWLSRPYDITIGEGMDTDVPEVVDIDHTARIDFFNANNNTDWTADFVDTKYIEIKEKDILLPEEEIDRLTVAGDSSSQYVQFFIPRFIDGIDVYDNSKLITVFYINGQQGSGRSLTINKKLYTPRGRAGEFVSFGWVIPSTATATDYPELGGELKFNIEILGVLPDFNTMSGKRDVKINDYDTEKQLPVQATVDGQLVTIMENNEFSFDTLTGSIIIPDNSDIYIWQSNYVTVPILPTLIGQGPIVKPETDWQIEFLLAATNYYKAYYDEVKKSVSEATTAGNTAKTYRDQAKAFADAASASASEASAYRDAASTSAANASTAEVNAKSYSETASGQANIASNAAATAGSHAATANAQAILAQASAENASSSANSASSSATNASNANKEIKTKIAEVDKKVVEVEEYYDSVAHMYFNMEQFGINFKVGGYYESVESLTNALIGGETINWATFPWNDSAEIKRLYPNLYLPVKGEVFGVKKFNVEEQATLYYAYAWDAKSYAEAIDNSTNPFDTCWAEGPMLELNPRDYLTKHEIVYLIQNMAANSTIDGGTY